MSSQPIDELSSSIFGYIARCPEQVYEAIVDPRQISRYFATGGAQGRMESGSVVTWDFADFPGAFPVNVHEASPSRKLVIELDGRGTISHHGTTTVTFIFEAIDDYTRTKLTITEHCWSPSLEGSQDTCNNDMGWTNMLTALKVWLEQA